MGDPWRKAGWPQQDGEPQCEIKDWTTPGLLTTCWVKLPPSSLVDIPKAIPWTEKGWGAGGTWRMEVYISCDRYSNNKLKKVQGQAMPVRSYILFRSHKSHLCLLLRAGCFSQFLPSAEVCDCRPSYWHGIALGGAVCAAFLALICIKKCIRYHTRFSV